MNQLINYNEVEIMATKILQGKPLSKEIEKSFLNSLENFTKDELENSKPIMELYSRALDNFDSDNTSVIDKSGIRKSFLSSFLVKITFIFCNYDVNTVCDALESFAIKEETITAIQNMKKFSCVLEEFLGEVEYLTKHSSNSSDYDYVESVKALKKLSDICQILDNLKKKLPKNAGILFGNLLEETATNILKTQ